CEAVFQRSVQSELTPMCGLVGSLNGLRYGVFGTCPACQGIPDSAVVASRHDTGCCSSGARYGSGKLMPFKRGKRIILEAITRGDGRSLRGSTRVQAANKAPPAL